VGAPPADGSPYCRLILKRESNLARDVKAGAKVRRAMKKVRIEVRQRFLCEGD
jgi:hypothetical protein